MAKRIITAVSDQVRDLIEASVLIGTVAPTSQDMAFAHAVLCQVGLPRAKVESREFVRRSGQAEVAIQAGYLDEGNGLVAQPIPYGPIPRLALAWVSTYAVRHRTREVPVGNSASEFMRLVGISNDGGRRYPALRKQMHALAACRLQLGYLGRTFNGQPVEQFDAWLSADDKQQAIWPGVLVLSEGYFKSLLDGAVPLDNRALAELTNTALGLDLYAWLAHRLHRIEGRPVTIHWASLREQFGQEFQGKNAAGDFKKQFKGQLARALAVYPTAKVKLIDGGLLLQSSPPPIPYRSKPALLSV